MRKNDFGRSRYVENGVVEDAKEYFGQVDT